MSSNNLHSKAKWGLFNAQIMCGGHQAQSAHLVTEELKTIFNSIEMGMVSSPSLISSITLKSNFHILLTIIRNNS